MTKHAAPKSDPVDIECPSKCIRRNCTPSALNDAGAWHFLEQYLQSNLGYAQMEDGLILYLGKRYCADDWAEAKLALFSSDGDDAKAMENLAALKNKYIVPKTSSSSLVPTAAFRSKWRRLKSCIFVDSKAGEGGEEEEEEEEYEAAWSPNTIYNRMYLLNLHRSVMDYIAEYLQNKGFPVTVSPWVLGQLYMVSESPQAISSSLPTSHQFSVKDYFLILDEERAVVEHSRFQLPSPGWARIKHGKYKNAIGYITSLKLKDGQSGPFVSLLVALQDFPYDMPKGSVALLDRSRLPAGKELSDIIIDQKVTETALTSSLQQQGHDTLSDPLFNTASILFGWVDSHDLMALLDMSLKEGVMQMQLQQEEERKMYRAQMEVSLFSNAIAHLCEVLDAKIHSIGQKKPLVKCHAWLRTLSPEDTLEVESHANRTLFGFSQTLEVPDHHEYFQGPNDVLISLPHLLKIWVDPVTYCAYMSASFAENKPQRIDNSDGFTLKENKTLDVLKSNIHILGLKKQRAQAEVDMFSEALARVAEFKGTDDGTCSGSTVMFASLPSDTLPDDWLDDCFSTSYTSLNASVLL
ncbi:uncharacterized protein F5891DRAFT_1196559 [Suillus fuscotomentosus]|uniref:Uncharacterized protein n=1 Tax=Suillus fuscotomentosus TaxID=1912939 RepID=A0AAD4DT42_9AGAM|nr:uncharacterized protein F5891DRAFT_1196559 [Suillus fuscotomentosus]KAG1893327.1 hypothetical protein F5891DRAFT_1196559 [Suillus fuscotomentosus]